MTGLAEDIEAKLIAAAPHGVEFSSAADRYGVRTAWCGLANRDDLVPVAKLLHALGARLATVTAMQPPAPEEEEGEDEEAGAEKKKEPSNTFGGTPLDGTPYEIDYHFVLGGDVLTVVAYVPSGGAIASLTPYFRGADWPEREIMETYSLAVSGHPNPRRLFLDPSIDGAVLERLIPFSTLVNAASTKALWDKVLSGRGAAS